jgi:hypothetical protein
MAALREPEDANGNTLSDASGRQYTWDFENRLTQAVVPGANGGTTTFRYYPFGRRIQKSGPLGTTNYLYDGMDSSANVIDEMNNARADLSTTEIYTHVAIRKLQLIHAATHPGAKLERKPSEATGDDNSQGDDEQRAALLATLEAESDEEE